MSEQQNDVMTDDPQRIGTYSEAFANFETKPYENAFRQTDDVKFECFIKGCETTFSNDATGIRAYKQHIYRDHKQIPEGECVDPLWPQHEGKIYSTHKKAEATHGFAYDDEMGCKVKTCTHTNFRLRQHDGFMWISRPCGLKFKTLEAYDEHFKQEHDYETHPQWYVCGGVRVRSGCSETILPPPASFSSLRQDETEQMVSKNDGVQEQVVEGEDDKEEEEQVGLLDADPVLTGKRQRKAVEKFVPKPVPMTKKVEVQGKGMALKDIHNAKFMLDKEPVDSDFLRVLHTLLYGSLGTKTRRRKEVKNFSGLVYSNAGGREKKRAQINAQTVYFVDKALRTLDVPNRRDTKTKDEKVDALLVFLEKPVESGKAKKSPRKKRTKKSKSPKAKKPKLATELANGAVSDHDYRSDSDWEDDDAVIKLKTSALKESPLQLEMTIKTIRKQMEAALGIKLKDHQKSFFRAYILKTLNEN